jgi:hypothetical protein
MGVESPAAAGRAAALALLLAVPLGVALAKSTRVTITVPVPARVDTSGLHRILVTRMIVDKELPEVDLDKEMVGLLRRELHKRTNFEIIETEPPPLPEQSMEALLANTGFWRKLAETHGADLVISGKVGLSVSDRSGFVQQDMISPLTGQRIRQTRYVDREGFELALSLFFVRGATGQILYEDRFTGENTVNGKSNDRLSALFNLFEQVEDDVVGILAPRTRTVQRNLFTE